MTTWPGHAVVQVPVEPLDAFVWGRWAHHDPSLVGTSRLPGERFVHAHVTLLGPFDLAPDPARVAAALEDVQPFTARLEGIEVFDNGIIHAPALPASRFEELTRKLRAAFPDVVPYRGEFAVRPHVTLEAIAPGVGVAEVAGWLGSALPARFTVRHVDVVWYQQHATRLVARLALGGGAGGAVGCRP